MNDLIVVTGATATGKTAYAAQLAREKNGELINADSRQVYKYLDIITGKDKISDVNVWLYDIVDPHEVFSSHDFVHAATYAIKDIRHRGKVPIIVGGSYLYIKHLLYGFDVAVPPNWKLRQELNDKPVAYLQQLLQQKNKELFESLNTSDRQNPHRLMRKIEIATYGVKTMDNKPQPIIPQKYIALQHKDRESLVHAIQIRVDKRLQQGAIEEVEQLLQKGYNETDPGLKTIGYQQIIKFLKGEYTREQAIQEWITKEVQYAKRQLTFMKKDKNITWKICKD